MIIFIGSAIGIGMTFYTKWLYVDKPLHIKSGTCTIAKCIYLTGKCTDDISTECKQYNNCYTYICYSFQLTISLILNNTNYTNTIHSYWYYNNQTICNSNTTTCDYDDRNIGSTLSIYKIYAIGFFDAALWILAIIATIIVTILLILWLHSLKWNNDY